MHRELLQLYNRELALLYEHAEEFAEEYPGIADRLGGLTRERSDPMVIGLLQGAALLAARVQLKLKHEFPEFTNNLIEQLLPNHLAPVPSAMLAAVRPTFGDPGLRDGKTIARGSALDAVYRERERHVACRYTLTSDVTYWPFELTRAEYYPAPGPLQALRVEVGPDVAAGLRLTLQLRTTVQAEDEPSEEAAREDPFCHFAGCPIRELPIHLVGPEAEAITLYEQMFSNLVGVYVRYLDSFGDPRYIRLPTTCIQQVGFDDGCELFPYDDRIFRGFNYLQEYFTFLRKFLGFRVTDLHQVIPALKCRQIDLIFAFDRAHPRLASTMGGAMFSLFSAPAINLFKKNSDRVPVEAKTHEYHVIPDRSQPLTYEPHRVIDVFLHYPGRSEKRKVRPLYMTSLEGTGAADDFYYTIRRVPRKRTADERRFGSEADYVGSEMYIALTIPPESESMERYELSVRANCSNRHLTEHLPVGQGGADFRLREDTSLDIVAAVAPTPPRESLICQKQDVLNEDGMGRAAWRLINLLSLNHLGLTEPDARALREILSMFADLSNVAIVRQITGIRRIESRPVMRRLQQRLGVGAARGIEITVTLEEKAFEGSGVYLLGATLDRFFAEYAAVNHFTVTVIRTVERGIIARWPPRSGSRSAL